MKDQDKTADANLLPVVSLLIVNHNTPDDVDRLLQSCGRFLSFSAYEAIIVNTTNKSGFPASSAPLSANVRVLTADSNRGFGESVNFGLCQARGRYVMAMNPDLLFLDDCLERMTDYMDAHPGVGILLPELLTADLRLHYNARQFYTWWTILCRRSPLGRRFPDVLARHLMMNQDRARHFPCDWGQGAAMLIRRNLFGDEPLFDGRYFLYFEDMDLCVRCWQAGYRVECDPGSRMVHHHRRESGRNPFGRFGRMHLASLLRFVVKHRTLSPGRGKQGASHA